jgi:cytochrome d ubiquinol oxidase subunit I
MALDALILSRIQFGFVIAFHILFPAFSIGLASFLAVLEGLWLATRRDVFKTLYLFWIKVFAIAFGMGVVSGVVLSYQLGTNWSEYSRLVSPAIGPLFGFEVMTAFFLEASFLGVMLFGWKKVGPGLHFVATVLVALGTLISAFWILSANSWMQFPTGFARAADGRFLATDYWALIFNPTFPTRFAHMVMGAYLTTALVVCAGSAFQLLKRGSGDFPAARTGLRMAVGMIAVSALVQIVVGDMSGRVMAKYQPSKLAAVEGFWDTRSEQAFHIVAWPDRKLQANRWEVSVPKAGSLLIAGKTSAVIPGLKAFARQDQPPALIVFWSFRAMVGMGVLMALLGFTGLELWRRKRLFDFKPYLMACVAMGPAGFITVVLGWITAEVGRQPWVVFGYLRTRDAVSPVSAGQVAFSLVAYMVVYAVIFGGGALYVLRLLARGADEAGAPPQGVASAPGSALGLGAQDANQEDEA